MCLPRPSRTHVTAVLLSTVAALFARAWLQIRLVGNGYQRSVAEDLSFLVVPLLLMVLLGPVLFENRLFIRRQFRRAELTLEVVLKAVAIAFLFRIAWHSHIVAGTAFGFYSDSTDPETVFSYSCPSPGILGLSVLVSCILIPLIEETTYRGFVQSFSARRGPIVAIAISSLTFAMFHRFGAWEFVLPAGVLLGTLYWITGSLWMSAIAHAVINFIPQLTLRCMIIPWSPGATETPVSSIGLISALIALASLAALLATVVSVGKHRDPKVPVPRCLE